MPIKFLNSGLLEGSLQLTSYGGGSISGTGTYNLGVDASGNVIETSLIEGSGTANYVVKWTPDGNTLGNSVIYDNGTNVGINATDFTTQYGVVPDLRVGSSSGVNNPGVIDILRKDGAVVAGDIAGILQFSVDDDNNYAVAQIETETAATSGTGNSGGGTLKFKTTPATSGGTPTERMQINSLGRVGIGTTNPTHSLQIGDGDGSESLQVSAASLSALYLSTPNSTAQSVIGFGNDQFATINTRGRILYQSSTTAASNYMQFTVAFNEVMRLTNDSVGIGTTNPSVALDVNASTGIKVQNQGDVVFEANPFGTFSLGDSAAVGGGAYITGDNTNIDFFGDGDVRFQNDGNVGIGTNNPQSKLQVNGAVQVADDTDAASASKVGALRYRTSGNNSYVDMCMQTGASTYAWVNIVENNW